MYAQLTNQHSNIQMPEKNDNDGAILVQVIKKEEKCQSETKKGGWQTVNNEFVGGRSSGSAG